MKETDSMVAIGSGVGVHDIDSRFQELNFCCSWIPSQASVYILSMGGAHS